MSALSDCFSARGQEIEKGAQLLIADGKFESEMIFPSLILAGWGGGGGELGRPYYDWGLPPKHKILDPISDLKI